LEKDWKTGGGFQEIPNLQGVSLEISYIWIWRFLMKKSSLFVSAALTTFVLAVLAGVLTAYRSYTANSGIQQITNNSPVPIVQAQPVIAQIPAATATSAMVTPEQASLIAAQYLGEYDLFSVDGVTLRDGSSAYQVNFSSGAIVYVSPQGTVMAVYAAPGLSAANSSIPNGPSSSGSEQVHEDDGD
jgi:hypothetical protein